MAEHTATGRSSPSILFPKLYIPLGFRHEWEMERSDEVDGRRAQCRWRRSRHQCLDSAAVTITVDEPVALGTLVLGSGTPSVGYTLNGSGSNTLTFSNTNNNTAATISVTDGTQFINAPVVLASKLIVTSTSSIPWTLTFGTASSITVNGNNLSLMLSQQRNSDFERFRQLCRRHDRGCPAH